MNLLYIPMTMGHYAAAYQLWQQTTELALTLGDSREAIQQYLERNPQLSFVCIDSEKNQVIGTILCGHDGRRGFIYHLAVHTDYRGQAIGKTLVAHSLQQLQQLGIERCMIMVKPENTLANAFWTLSNWDKREDLWLYSKNL